MAKALPRVKEMISKLIESGSKIPTWVLTSFNDPDVDVRKETKDVEELRSALKELRYGGGGDVEEQAFEGAIKDLEYTHGIWTWSIILEYNPGVCHIRFGFSWILAG